MTPSAAEIGGQNVYNIPAGVFISPGHSWVSIETNGLARVGIDDFLNKIIGPIDSIELPKAGAKISRGERLMSIVQTPNVLNVLSPISGTVRRVNSEILDRLELLRMKPYELGWLCCIEPSRLSEDLENLVVGADALAWYEDELRQFRHIAHEGEVRRHKAGAAQPEAEVDRGRLDPETWAAIARTFIRGGVGTGGAQVS